MLVIVSAIGGAIWGGYLADGGGGISSISSNMR